MNHPVLGSDHRDTATSYNNLGIGYDHKGYYEKAVEFYNNDLTFMLKVLGPDHPDTATS